jgi:hypothetical protein
MRAAGRCPYQDHVARSSPQQVITSAGLGVLLCAGCPVGVTLGVEQELVPSGTEMGLAMTLPDLAPSPAGLQYPARTEGSYTVAALSGDLDVACAPVLREQLLGELTPRASRLVVELSQVSFCDASTSPPP